MWRDVSQRALTMGTIVVMWLKDEYKFEIKDTSSFDNATIKSQ
jgi:hypothetical protein